MLCQLAAKMIIDKTVVGFIDQEGKMNEEFTFTFGK